MADEFAELLSRFAPKTEGASVSSSSSSSSSVGTSSASTLSTIPSAREDAVALLHRPVMPLEIGEGHGASDSSQQQAPPRQPQEQQRTDQASPVSATLAVNGVPVSHRQVQYEHRYQQEREQRRHQPLPDPLLIDADRCPHCHTKHSIILNHRDGDMVCKTCGMIVQDHVVDADAEYRIFEGDQGSQGKARVGKEYSPWFLTDMSTSDRSAGRDEFDFLWSAEKALEASLFRLFLGHAPGKIKWRAKELFQQSFKLQLAQKEGRTAMASGNSFRKDARRQKFARRKPFVVASVYAALVEHDVIRTYQQICDTVPGASVSRKSLRKCLQELNATKALQALKDEKEGIRKSSDPANNLSRPIPIHTPNNNSASLDQSSSGGAGSPATVDQLAANDVRPLGAPRPQASQKRRAQPDARVLAEKRARFFAATLQAKKRK